MDDIQRIVAGLMFFKEKLYNGIFQDRIGVFDEAISAMQELQQYRERLKQLRHAEVLRFECKLPDGRICHFSDFLDFLENGQVK